MDLKEYYRDLGRERERLERSYPAGEIFVTSVYNRDKGSKAGMTVSVSANNAARVLTDGTHKIASKAEIAKYIEAQERNRVSAVRSEQLKKQQYVVVVDPAQPSAALASNGLQAAAQAAAARTSSAAAAAAVAAAEAEEDEEEAEESDD